jgi:hypothetical protein
MQMGDSRTLLDGIKRAKLLMLLCRYKRWQRRDLIVQEAGKQRYFYLKNVPVMFTKVEAVKASCNGTLCDRQSSFVQTGSCGCLCLYFNRFSAIVLDIHDSDIHDH